MKTLIAYGTRFGATARSAQILGDELIGKYGHEVAVLDADKIAKDDFNWADQVIIGSSIVKGRWKGSCRRLLKLTGKNSKPVAVFVSAAVVLSEQTPMEKLAKSNGENVVNRERYAIEKFIDPLCDKYSIKPFAKAAFGGKLTVFGKVVIDNQDEAPVKAWAEKLTS